MNNNKNQQYTPALGGFFSWLKRAVQNVANAVIEISHNPAFVLDIFHDAFDNDGSFTLGNQGNYLFRVMPSSTTEPPLSASDEQKLDIWVQTRFLPFFQTFFSTLKTFSISPPSTENFNTHFNNVHRFISFIEWYKGYVLTHGEGTFSQNALVARNQFFDAQLELLEEDLEDFMNRRNMQVNTTTVTMGVMTSKYSQLGFNTPVVVNLNVLEVATPTTSGQLPVNTNPSNPSNNGVTSNPIDTIPQVTQTQTTTKKGGSLWLLLLGVGAILAIRGMSNDDLPKPKKGKPKKQSTYETL